MKNKTKMLVIAKDDFPLEIVTKKGHPIRNFIARKIKTFLWGDHVECWKCYEKRKGIKVI